MPFLRDYACPAGHITEELHMGSQATAPALITCGCGEQASPVCAAWARKPGKIDLTRYLPSQQEPRRYQHW